MDQKIQKSVAIIIIFLIIGIFLVKMPSKNENPENIKQVKVAGQIIKVELALTDVAKAEGLSGRSEMNNDAGMLFVFDEPGKYDFWMKGMLFSLDIIWLAPSEDGDGDASVVYIKKSAQSGKALETYGPEKDAKYVLEVNAGFSEKNNLKEGDNVEFVY